MLLHIYLCFMVMLCIILVIFVKGSLTLFEQTSRSVLQLPVINGSTIQKVLIYVYSYLEYHSVCPLVRIETLPTASPPCLARGGVEGLKRWGEQIRTT